MDLNSRLFDRIRVKKAERAPEKAPTTPCSFPAARPKGCSARQRAVSARASISAFAAIMCGNTTLLTTTFAAWTTRPWRVAPSRRGRPPSNLEDGRAAAAAGQPVDESVFAEARAARRRGAKGKPPQTEPPPRYNALAIKALLTLELGGDATPAKIKSRYKELVKRHHPDANGGDRSSEERLREIIQAYNFLRANKLV